MQHAFLAPSPLGRGSKAKPGHLSSYIFKVILGLQPNEYMHKQLLI